jgi:hypothetical protein
MISNNYKNVVCCVFLGPVVGLKELFWTHETQRLFQENVWEPEQSWDITFFGNDQESKHQFLKFILFGIFI